MEVNNFSVRYDVKLELNWLRNELGLDVSMESLEQMREFDNPKFLKQAYEIGARAVIRQVQTGDFPAVFDES